MNPIALAAYLGSPASELSRVLDVEVAELYERQTSRHAAPLARMRPLPGIANERLSAWLACLTWWNDWRHGGMAAAERQMVDAVGSVARQLDVWPVEFARDLGLAQRGMYLANPASERDPVRRGVRLPQSRLTPDGIRAALTAVEAGETIERVSRRMGVHRSTLSRALRGETWGEVGHGRKR